MDQETIDSYDDDIIKWISKQGSFFQFFIAPRMVVGTGSVGVYILGLCIRVFAFLCLAALIFAVFTARAHMRPAFKAKIIRKVSHSLHADSVKVSKAKSGVLDSIEIPELSCIGGTGSFFETLLVQNAVMDLGLFVSKKKMLKTQSISCSKIDIYMKTSGAFTKDNQSIFDPLFNTTSWFQFENIDARLFNCEWGYSENTKGIIQKGELSMTRYDGGWLAEIRGGTLTYCWLKKVNIESIKMIIKPNQFDITEATFTKGGTTFSLNMKTETFGEYPKVSGGGSIKNGKLKNIINSKLVPYIGGDFNAAYTFEGSPVLATGLKYSFKPLISEVERVGVTEKVEEANVFKIHRNLPVWRALNTIDSSISYRNLSFDQTDWLVEVQGDKVKVKDAVLKNKKDRNYDLTLAFELGAPSDLYIKEALSGPKTELNALLADKKKLEKARQIITSRGDFKDDNNMVLEDDDYRQLIMMDSHFNGKATLKVHEKSFQDKPKLTKEFPLNSEGMREIPIILDGAIEQVTQETADRLYKLIKK